MKSANFALLLLPLSSCAADIEHSQHNALVNAADWLDSIYPDDEDAYTMACHIGPGRDADCTVHVIYAEQPQRLLCSTAAGGGCRLPDPCHEDDA